jgi:hypothetical protein
MLSKLDLVIAHPWPELTPLTFSTRAAESCRASARQVSSSNAPAPPLVAVELVDATAGPASHSELLHELPPWDAASALAADRSCNAASVLVERLYPELAAGVLELAGGANRKRRAARVAPTPSASPAPTQHAPVR